MSNFFHENLDFLIWATVIVCTYVITVVALHHSRRADNSVLRITAVVLLALIFSAYWSLEETRSRELRRIAALLIRSAPAYAAEIEQMGHAGITLATPMDDPRYLQIVNKTLEWIRLNPIVKGIYTCRRYSGGKIRLIVDPEVDINADGKIDGLEVRTPIGEEWDADIPNINEAFLGRTVMTNKPYADEWGEWLTAFSPLHDADGKVEAVLGVDFPAGEWMAIVRRACRMRLLGWGFLGAIFLGGCGMTSALLSDLKARRKIEEKLRETERRFSHLAEQSRNLVLEFDVPSRRIRYASPNHAEVTGLTPAELMGRDCLTGVHPEDQQMVAQAIEKPKIFVTFRSHHRNGSWLWMEMVGMRIQALGGESRVQAVCHDVTERKISEMKLQEAQKMESLGQLAAGLAHDFNNALTIVQGYSQFMLDNDGLQPKQESMLRLVDEAAGRAASLTRQLLAFGRAQSLNRAIFGINQVINGLKEMLQSLLGEQIQVHFNLAENQPNVAADIGTIEQVILNVALNARDAMPDGGHLSIRTGCEELDALQARRHPEARAGRFACIAITDTGVGMDENTRKHLFEPFFTTKEFGEGTGLGLASAYGIINQHGGWIEVTSHVGAGTKFEIFLPVTDDSQTTGPENQQSVPISATGTESILIVEDEPALLQLAETILTSQGYKVRSAQSGREALASLNNGDVDCDLLMTDLVMPGGISGGQLARTMQNKKPGLRVLYTTGYSPESIGTGLNLKEGYNYLAKPYNGHKLTRAVRTCLDAIPA